jgi:hypothetical protein
MRAVIPMSISVVDTPQIAGGDREVGVTELALDHD